MSGEMIAILPAGVALAICNMLKFSVSAPS